jgi:hypothetical protein
MSSVWRVISFVVFCQGKLRVRLWLHWKQIAYQSVRVTPSYRYTEVLGGQDLFSVEPETAIIGTEQVGVAVKR